MPSLQYALAIPSSGGKTTLCNSNTFFVDIDILYTLRPIPALWNHMNHEIRRRSNDNERVPLATATELRSRIENYSGPGRCLLTHSIAVAEKTGLQVLGVLVPSIELHQKAMIASHRNEIACWFARQNAQVLREQATKRGIKAWKYATFDEFEDVITSLFPTRRKYSQVRVEKIKANPQAATTFGELRSEEELLLQLCTTATGCMFSDDNDDDGGIRGL